MVGTAKHIGRVGALAVALGIGSVRRTATRATVTIGAAALVASAGVTAMPASTESPAVTLTADSTALILCGTTCPTPDAYWVDSAMKLFIVPTHPLEEPDKITPVAVTTPEEAWPITGLLRVLALVTGDPRLFGPGGPAWPDEPWWKLSGLFDLTADQSVEEGVADLEDEMANYGNDHLVIFGDSQSANIANKEKRKLAEQYPEGTPAPDIDFVLLGDPNLPNGGLAARFPGLPTVILGTFDGPELTNTQFHTDVITRQYDGGADFPLYPLNIVADLNAVLGFFYVHTDPFGVSLPADPELNSPAYQGTYGDSSYYFFESEDLPLFAPLRQLGVPESVIDVFEPFFRVIVELGYDRTIPPWEPTPARLFPTTFDPVKVSTDLVDAIGEGVDNARELVGAPAPFSAYTAPPAPQQDPEELTESIRPNGAAISNLLAAHRDIEESTSTSGTDSDSAGHPKLKPFATALVPKPNSVIRSVVQKLKDVTAPLKDRLTTANRNDDNPGPGAAAANSGDNSSPSGADS
ncbi:PE-PPE domain-containing protein [Mycolicibacterium moriokaense]|nr:PE-PPE domain-containing protein [Mycolicibacterium moriokaense]